jgi:predicted O-methyltransferase YrrM
LSDVLERVLADQPVVHPMSADPDAPLGVWSTEAGCYRFIAERVGPGTRTLETGCGTSTVLLAALGADHICVTPGPEERERLLAHTAARGIPVDRVRFEVASSHEGLPRLAAEGIEVDLVLVDGSHGYPMPIIDWFYAGAMLRRGGVLVLDDLPLPAVRLHARILDRDPRWRRLARTKRWGAWERLSSGPLCEDWTAQPHVEEPARRFVNRVRGKLRTIARGAR